MPEAATFTMQPHQTTTPTVSREIVKISFPDSIEHHHEDQTFYRIKMENLPPLPPHVNIDDSAIGKIALQYKKLYSTGNMDGIRAYDKRLRQNLPAQSSLRIPFTYTFGYKESDDSVSATINIDLFLSTVNGFSIHHQVNSEEYLPMSQYSANLLLGDIALSLSYDLQCCFDETAANAEPGSIPDYYGI